VKGGGEGEPDRRPRVSVIVPVTERPESLEELYRSASEVLRDAGYAHEFLFVLEPWGYRIAEPLRRLAAEGLPVRILELGRAMGESAMLQAAAERASGSLLLTLPPYPRIQVQAIPRLLEAVEEGADLALARRDPTGRSWSSRIQSRVFHGLLRLAVGGGFHDVASGVRALRPAVLDDVPLYGDLFRFLPVFAEREGFHVREVLVPAHPSESRPRVYTPGIYLRRIIDLVGVAFLVRFTRKPLRFFGLVGAAAAMVGAAILVVLTIQRLGGQGMADRPALLLGVLCFVLGIQALGIGLVGEIIVHLNASSRRHYRLRGEGRDEPPGPASSAGPAQDSAAAAGSEAPDSVSHQARDVDIRPGGVAREAVRDRS
jgi:hypothetical protein